MVITTKIPDKVEAMSLEVAETAQKEDTAKRSWVEVLFVFFCIAAAFCFIGYDSTFNYSPFRCSFETKGINVLTTDKECKESYLLVTIAVFIGVISLVANYSLVMTTFARMVQICGLVWLKFLMEKYQYFAHATISIGYFGFAILCGIILADVASIPKAPPKNQMFYMVFMTVITLATLIAEYCFSVYWIWSQTSFTILGLTIFITSLCIYIFSSLKPEPTEGDFRSWPSVCITGLCVMLMILIPSCHFALYFHQVSVVAVGTLVYVFRWWIPIFNHKKEVVPIRV